MTINKKIEELSKKGAMWVNEITCELVPLAASQHRIAVVYGNWAICLWCLDVLNCHGSVSHAVEGLRNGEPHEITTRFIPSATLAICNFRPSNTPWRHPIGTLVGDPTGRGKLKFCCRHKIPEIPRFRKLRFYGRRKTAEPA